MVYGNKNDTANHLDKRLGSLEGVEEDVEGFAFDSVVLDNNARATDDLSGGAFGIELAETGPFAEGHLGVTFIKWISW